MKNNSISTAKTIMALDPSSTCCGFAMLDWQAQLIIAGLIEPDNRQAASYLRIQSLRNSLREVLNSQQPGIVLIEWTKGKVNINRHHGCGAGLAVYGCGVGALATEAEHWSAGIGGGNRPQVIPVFENTWTRGVPKSTRQAAIAGLYPQYDPALDGGGDIADAIGLAYWYIKEQLILG